MPRELIDTGTDKRFVRRDKKGQFKESDDVGRSPPKIRSGIRRISQSAARVLRRPVMSGHLRQALKSPIVIFALVCAVIGIIGAPLFALSDVIN